MSNFHGTYEELQQIVTNTGIKGEWQELQSGHKQFRSKAGAVLNWWEGKKGTLLFQGSEKAKQDLEIKFNASENGEVLYTPTVTADENTKIFIVHGHDTAALEQLELIIRRLGLDPFILQNNDAQSKTLIEALELQIYEKSACGIVLMTPDDYGYPKTKADTDRLPRARQNVVLEMGMVMASLGREKTIILKKGNLEMPSDVQGVVYLEFNEHVKEIATKLAQKMKTLGIEIEDELIFGAGA